MPRVFRLPLARHLAASLAAWGLLALPLRSLAACPMQEPAAAAAATGATAALDEHGEHAGHEMPAGPSDGAGDHHGPTHDVCPDVAHCAAALLRDRGPELPQGGLACADVASQAGDRLSSVGRTLDTPPPKRS